MTPHYVRFARALSLVSSLSGFSSLGAGCYQAHELVEDASPDAQMVDVGVLDAGPPSCRPPLPCTCPRLGQAGTCDSTPYWRCCPVVGPLSPPELAA